ncbi:MAG: SPOR domain-containing protein [Sideroxydans sp.]|nr:SPOR domain-containing protein [Sideroxydans sp.]
MAKQLTDEELTLRRKLRRRLIGASVLVLTLVVVLPMLLDSEPKATGQDIELRIPASDKVGEFVPGVPSVEQADAPMSGVNAAASGVVATSERAVVASPTAVVAAPLASLPITRKVADPAVAAPPEVNKPEVKKSAVKIPEAKPLSKPAVEKSVSSFVAQVGAYSNADTAQQQLTQLKDWHFKAYTEKVGDKTRVRVGPYASREQAEQVRALLEKHGLHPVVSSAK